MTASLQINKNSGFLVNGGQYGAFLTTSMGGDCRFSTIACSAFNRRLHSLRALCHKTKVSLSVDDCFCRNHVSLSGDL